MWRDLRRVLDEEVSRLPDKYRSAFVLCCLKGKTNEEAARELSCPTGTILSRLNRARARLRLGLARRGLALTAGLLTAAVTERAGVVPASAMEITVRAARALAAGMPLAEAASVSVTGLVQGATHTMFWTKWKIVAAMLVFAGLVGLGGKALNGSAQGADPAQEQPPSQPPVVQPNEVKGFAVPLQPAWEQAAARQPAESRQNLLLVALAMQRYQKVTGHMPAPAIYDRNGKALLSWRVAMLPFLEEDALYQQFHLHEAWDSPHNKFLLGQIPKVYRAPPDTSWGQSPSTFLQVFVGPGAAFEAGRQLRPPEDFPDGLATTILVAEAEEAVPWTQPVDLPYAPDQALPKLGPQLQQFGFHIATADGSVYTVRKEFDPRLLRAAITRNGGEAFDLEKLVEPKLWSPRGQSRQRLLDQNQRLKRALQQARQELDHAKQDLRSAAETLPADDESAWLKEENAKLEKLLVQTQAETRALRAELETLNRSKSRKAPSP
jgi:hypothetical protein